MITLDLFWDVDGMWLIERERKRDCRRTYAIRTRRIQSKASTQQQQTTTKTTSNWIIFFVCVAKPKVDTRMILGSVRCYSAMVSLCCCSWCWSLLLVLCVCPVGVCCARDKIEHKNGKNQHNEKNEKISNEWTNINMNRERFLFCLLFNFASEFLYIFVCCCVAIALRSYVGQSNANTGRSEPDVKEKFEAIQCACVNIILVFITKQRAKNVRFSF